MQGRQNQMSGLCCRNRCTDRLIIPHLTYENNIRILPECGMQCLLKGRYIFTNLPLMDHGLSMIINVFDRIFNSYYMFCLIFIHIIDHGCQCGRLTASCRACDQDQSAWLIDQLPHCLWNLQLIKGRDLII